MKRKTLEEYLKVIYLLEKRNGHAKTGEISSELDVKPPSVTEMLKKLEEEGYLKYKRYEGVKLTRTGKNIARNLMISHETIADFLKIIGVEGEQAELDACELEHHISQTTLKKLNKLIEFIDDAPDEPKWIEHYRHYVKTGERKECEFYKNE
ncbi:MAG: metal-dependent transcriptional regulator [Candidatus Thermoplasmatota archaeon]|nr:metal-dependent transcriptional regulator [Candidatus Thermoplasmatota archaeon]MBS3790990.1 metal-dependent transcriptional regulator [Candidatus Thermoplasmatota archaeon]